MLVTMLLKAYNSTFSLDISTSRGSTGSREKKNKIFILLVLLLVSCASSLLQRCTSVFGPYACVLLVVGILAGYCVLMPVFFLCASSLPLCFVMLVLALPS